MTTYAPPIEQRETALTRANDVRLRRAIAKRWIVKLDRRRAELELGLLLIEAPDYLESATIGDVLSWPRRWGADKVRKFLARLEINESAQVAGERRRGAPCVLTDRQRRLIARELTR